MLTTLSKTASRPDTYTGEVQAGRPTVLDSVLHPAVLMVLPMVLSFLAWILPLHGVDRGFGVRAPLSAGAVVVIAIWVISSVAAATVGHLLGGLVSPVSRLDGVDARRFEVSLSVIASVGVIYAYFLASRQVSIVAALQGHVGNQLRMAIPYAPGLATLRYAAPVAAAVSVHRLATGKGRKILTAWNVAMLLGAALLASRLSLLLAATILVFLFRKSRRITAARIGVVAVAGLLLLFFVTVPFNYVRNAGYYELRGISNPLAMNASQMLAYLATPTQVEMTLADAYYHGRIRGGQPDSAVLLPSYFVPKDDAASIDGPRYGAPVDLEPGFTTNSVLADVGSSGGIYALLAALSGSVVAGATVGHFRQYKGYVSSVAAILLYGFAEWWRIYLLGAGILHFALFLVIGIAVVCARGSGVRGEGRLP